MYYYQDGDQKTACVIWNSGFGRSELYRTDGTRHTTNTDKKLYNEHDGVDPNASLPVKFKIRSSKA